MEWNLNASLQTPTFDQDEEVEDIYIHCIRLVDVFIKNNLQGIQSTVYTFY